MNPRTATGEPGPTGRKTIFSGNPKAVIAAGLAGLAVLAGGCDNMERQGNRRAYAPSEHFPDGASARTPPAHAVQSGPLAPADFRTGRRGGQWVGRIPVPVTETLLRRGRECFNAQCAECHGEDGYGGGIVVKRGFPAPPSFHEDRLRAAPAGQLFEAITLGYGVMLPAGFRVGLEDRWAIVAYIRALQRSQHASLADVPPSERPRMTGP